MHIVILAWLFVIVTMSLTLSSAIAGVLLFVLAGILPVLFWAVIASRRARASVREREMRERDHREPETD